MWLTTIFLQPIPSGISLAGKILISALGTGISQKRNLSWFYREMLINVSVQITENYQVAFLLVFQRIAYPV